MGKPVAFICPVESCEYHYKIIQAEKLPIRIHLITKHDYTEYQETAKKYGLTSDIAFRSRLWFVDKLSEIGIVR